MKRDFGKSKRIWEQKKKHRIINCIEGHRAGNKLLGFNAKQWDGTDIDDGQWYSGTERCR